MNGQTANTTGVIGRTEGVLLKLFCNWLTTLRQESFLVEVEEVGNCNVWFQCLQIIFLTDTHCRNWLKKVIVCELDRGW